MNPNYLLLILFLVICAACSSGTSETVNILHTAESLAQNPFPTPEFVVNIGNLGDASFSESECIEISQKPFWEGGMDSTKLTNHLIENLRFSIDYNEIPKANTEMIFDMVSYHIVDEDNSLIGLYGGNITICAAINNLQPGWHIAMVSLTGLSDKEVSYTWSFRVD